MKKLSKEDKKRLAEMLRTTGSYPDLMAKRLLKMIEENRSGKRKNKHGEH